MVASGLTFGIAYLLNNTLDYSSIFLNLSTDFIMVVITIWYVDRMLKRHEDERWKGIDFLINYKVYNLANSIIETFCIPLGIHDKHLPLHQEFVEKLRSQKRGNGVDTDYYGDFAKKFLAGHFITDTEIYKLNRDWSKERISNARINSETSRKIYEKLLQHKDEINQLIDFYNIRINPSQLEALMNLQFWLQNNITSFDNYMARNEWLIWYQSSLGCLSQCLEVLEASTLHWTIVPQG